MYLPWPVTAEKFDTLQKTKNSVEFFLSRSTVLFFLTNFSNCPLQIFITHMSSNAKERGFFLRCNKEQEG
jgi:hypothetical protein